jgi:prepilin-type processing-associated H-X9-DG protein
VPQVKIPQIRNGADCILVAEEDWTTVNDGCWCPQAAPPEPNLFARNHQVPRNRKGGKGNAGFVDGHVECITREQAHLPKHYKPRTSQVPAPLLFSRQPIVLPPNPG